MNPRPLFPKRATFLAATSLLATVGSLQLSACAQAPAMRPPSALIGMDDAQLARITPSDAQVTVTRSTDQAAPGFLVSIATGPAGYPGVAIKPPGQPWDESQFGHITAHVTNTGDTPETVAMRIDNAGDWKDNPSNTESTYLKPGASGVITIIFGYSYNHQPSFALKPNAIVNLLLFAGKADHPQSFRIDDISAEGPPGEKPPVDPESIRIAPVNGWMLGGGATVDATRQISTHEAEAVLAPNAAKLTATYKANAKAPAVTLKPPAGRWSLINDLQVVVTAKNTGTAPVKANVRLETNGGPSPWYSATLAPGAVGEITIPFDGLEPSNLSDESTKVRITSNQVQGVTVGADPTATDQPLEIESVRANVPPPVIPAWLGQRPPVTGAWTKTLDEEFDANTIDPSLWNVTGDNYYDKRTHWSPAEDILGGGELTLRYEKKTGPHNDDPAGKVTNYAAGFLSSIGKWSQRYGYFEARMKMPTAPGLWPAFWLMPDRGVAAGPQWKRMDTVNGGMEMDIAEDLTGWGPYRYNIAQHWDGYGKDHKSNGSDRVYVHPDKDGYITCGVLWTPGSLAYYCNGQELLHWENERVSTVPAIFLFTFPSGGWDNTPLEDAKLPADWKIDYVRAWQRQDLASPADGKIAQPPVAAAAPAAVPATATVPAAP